MEVRILNQYFSSK